jgi:methanogenic corrinoid protein MtbC1
MRSPDDALIDYIRRADRQGANAFLDAWACEHGCERLLSDLLEPALLHIGEEWCARDSFTLAQAYVAARIAEDVLVRIAAQTAPRPESTPPKGVVVIGNIQDDFHALGRRMLGTFLRADGWVIHDLGNDVAPAAFVDAAVERGARIIGVSAMMLTTARGIRLVREEIDRRGLTGKIQLAVGGAVFLVRPELVREVGGDGTAPNALGASRLFAGLWHRSLQAGGTP